MTKIGISDYGMDSIEKISIHLKIASQNSKTPKVEIQRISPTDEIRTVGTITHKDNIVTNMGGGVNGSVSSELDLKFLKWKIGGDGNFTKKSDAEVMVTYNYPKQFLITRSNGAGNDAMWDFKQGESFGWKGQYDLNIIFTIRKPIEEIQKDNPSYYLKFDVFINNKKIKFEPNGPVKNSAPIEFIY